MDKKKILQAFIHQLNLDLEAARRAADNTREAATNEESRPENQYDTRALEASYLAGAQAHRVREIEAQLTMFRHTDLHSYSDEQPIGPTALVEIQSGNQKSLVFIMPQAGGLTIVSENKTVQIVTPSSPLGEVLIGLQVGEVAVVENLKSTKSYQILSVR